MAPISSYCSIDLFLDLTLYHSGYMHFAIHPCHFVFFLTCHSFPLTLFDCFLSPFLPYDFVFVLCSTPLWLLSLFPLIVNFTMRIKNHLTSWSLVTWRIMRYMDAFSWRESKLWQNYLAKSVCIDNYKKLDLAPPWNWNQWLS